MQIFKTTLPAITAVMASALIGLVSTQALSQELRNPAIAMTNEAMVATGTCVAKYVSRLDNASLEPEAVAKRVAARCQQLISRSVGLATLMSGRPDDYAKNLAYINAVFTTNAVVRSRASGSKPQV